MGGTSVQAQGLCLHALPVSGTDCKFDNLTDSRTPTRSGKIKQSALNPFFLVGAACGGSFLPVAGSGGGAPPPYAHGVAPYFKLYGTGQFDGQASGHEFMGNVFFPSTGES